MMEKYIADALYPFSLAEKQLLLTIRDRAAEYGAALDDIAAAIEIEIEELKAAVVPAEKRPKKPTAPPARPETQCPLCGSTVAISPVNVSKCTRVGGSWKTSLMCKNKDCRFTELSEKSLKEWGK